MREHRLRWGILGAARVAHHWARAALQCSNAALVAIASRSLSSGRSFGNAYNCEKIHASYDALLDDPEVDAVYIPLPNSLHVSWTLRCIRAKKHVLCEKPFATTAAAIATIMQLRDQYGVHVTEGFAHLYHPQFCDLKSLLLSQVLGEIRCIQCMYSGPLLDRGGIIADKQMGGGALLSLGCYAISSAISIFGESPSHASSAESLAMSGVDECCSSFLAFSSGATMFNWSSIQSTLRQSMTVLTDKATVHMPVPFRPDLDGNRNGYTVTKDGALQEPREFPPCNPFVAEIQAFGECVLKGHENSAWPLSLSLHAASAIERLRANSQLLMPSDNPGLSERR